MLTENQISKLEPLTLHAKFGRLLKDAIEVWKREDVTPIYNRAGIWQDEEIGIWNLLNGKECCLIGASLVDKSYISSESYSEDARIHFNLFKYEIASLVSSFDDHSQPDDDAEASDFAAKVRNIVNPKNYYRND